VANGHSAVWCDYDNDGLLDLYLCSDGDQNRLFHNDGAGGFTDAAIAPLDVRGPSFAAAWADYDGDGAMDLMKGRLQLSAGGAPSSKSRVCLAAEPRCAGAYLVRTSFPPASAAPPRRR
jgi:hypothetical protein